MDKWRLLCKANNQVEAELIKVMLEAQHILVVTQGESLGVLYGFSTGPMAEVRIYVPDESLDQARELLAAVTPDLTIEDSSE